jgi:hypothetical protein
MKLGKGPSLPAAVEEVYRVAQKVGGNFAAKWGEELRLIQARLKERNPRGPKGVSWPTEAARIQLAADVAEHGHEQRQAILSAKAIAEKLPGLEAKAVSAEDILDIASVRLQLEAIVGEEAEQVRLDPRSGNGKAAGFEGKAIAGWSRDKECDLMRLIRRVGGFVPDGGRAGSILDYDAPHVERAMQLIRGEAEPDSDHERRELDRWQRKYDEPRSTAGFGRREDMNCDKSKSTS